MTTAHVSVHANLAAPLSLCLCHVLFVVTLSGVAQPVRLPPSSVLGRFLVTTCPRLEKQNTTAQPVLATGCRALPARLCEHTAAHLIIRYAIGRARSLLGSERTRRIRRGRAAMHCLRVSLTTLLSIV